MQKLKGINLVIASGSEKIQNCLQELFIKQGADVVLCGFLNLHFVDQLEKNICADVILIDMDDSYEEDEEALDRLLEIIDLPILFHDNDFDELNEPNGSECFSFPAVEKLASKLAELVDSNGGRNKSSELKNTEQDSLAEDKELEINKSELFAEHSAVLKSLADINVLLKEDAAGEPSAEEKFSTDIKDIKSSEPADEINLVGTSHIEHHEKKYSNAPVKDSNAPVSPAEDSKNLVNVWILGASIGGPEAVKRFLARIPKELPVAFVLAQHLGDGFVSLLANQLDRASSFSVKEGIAGDSIKHGEVVVVPVAKRMSLNGKGQIKFIEEDWKGHYKPSIDCVIDDVTGSFKKQSGIIIFSGMGADGVLASQQFSEKYDGIVWAQSSETCVISSMPDSVRKANLVSYSGSPEALALKIAVHYMGKDSYIV